MGKKNIQLTSILILLTIAIVFTLITVPATAYAADIYGFIVRLTTTSDWTRVKFEGASASAFKEEIIEMSGAEDLRVGAGKALSVNKASFDDSMVVLDYRVYLRKIEGFGLNVSIKKGGIGYTKLEFNRLNDRGSPFLTLTNEGSVQGDPENEKETLVPKSTPPETELRKDEKLDVERKTLAFYYPWYGTPEGPTGRWNHWNPNNSYSSPHVPRAGYYDSQSKVTIKRHIKQAKANGIDGFIASWWGSYSFSNRSFSKLLEISEELDFRVTIYLEKASSRRHITQQLSYVFENYAGSPAFLKVDGDPVIFCYGRVTNKFEPSAWNEVFSELEEKGMEGFFVGDSLSSGILEAFDGLHTYNPVFTPIEELTEQYESASFKAEVTGKLFAATVVPGYDDRVVRDPGDFKKRRGGKLYRRFWNVAFSSSPDWILITSFNEWHEGTEIEPSEEFGDKYLKLTRKFAKEWKGGD